MIDARSTEATKTTIYLTDFERIMQWTNILV